MGRIARAVDASVDGDLIELSARYQKLETELDHAAAEFAAAAKAAGESPPVRFMPTIRSYRQRGDDLLKLAAARRVAMDAYSSHFEQLNARVKKSLDHARNMVGSAVARQSLVKLTANLDDLRGRYADFVSADTVDSPTLDALGVSEGILAQSLTEDRPGFTRAEGQGWYTKSLGDLQSMSGARKALLHIDRQRKDGARHFGDDSDAVSRIVGEMGKTETYDARLSGSPAASGGAPGALAAVAAGGADTRQGASTNAAASDVRGANGANERGAVSLAAVGAGTGRGTSASSATSDTRQTISSASAGADTRSGVPLTAAAAGTGGGASPSSADNEPRQDVSHTPTRANARGDAPFAEIGDDTNWGASASSAGGDTRKSVSPNAPGADARAGMSIAGTGADPRQGASRVPAAADAHSDAPFTATGDTNSGVPITADGPHVDIKTSRPVSLAADAATGDPAAAADQGVQRGVATNTAEQQNHSNGALVAWLIGGVLLLVVCTAAATAARILRPVRRLLSATARIANGESGVTVPRGGIRELDALALAVNDMAAQLAAAREETLGQQHLLEARVAERTLQLQELAQLDPLTHLANRRYFFELLNAAIESATRENRFVGVFFLDIDNFKNMNDNLGHEFGDQVLQSIARRLSESAHSFGFAARLGGDEFTVAYESASSIEDIRIAGLQLIGAFQEPILLDGRELIVSVSAGASVYPDHAQNAEALLRAADAALYEAKAIGRSQLALFEPALLEAATARFTTEQGLRRAIERGEFELAFQPEVNLQTCEIEVVEALLRWRLPEGRYASPGEFLAVAESSGLILPINDWVIRRAIETVAHWRQGAWPSARVAINVSSRQLFDNSFVEQVQALLEEYKLPPGCIEIELTENVLQTGSATIASLHRLHALGIGIALDDFGTGFSSLASLEQLPLSRIKLDRSLIASIDTSGRSAAIARAIIHLCQGLGLLVTAEGVERPEQLAPLVGYPGLHAQGYLLAHPQYADQLLQVMATLPTLTRALVRSSVARLPDSQLAENLPFVTAAGED